MVMNCMQHPMPRRVHVRTSQDLKLDPERPEYHRATVHWRRYTPFNVTLRLAEHGLWLRVTSDLLWNTYCHAAQVR